jgi:hypothetical protein
LCKKKKFCFKKDFLFEKRKQKDKRRKIRRKKCAAGRGKSGRGGGNMKGGTVQIAWHGSQPVLSLDFHSPSGLLATAGADHDIKVFSVFCFIFPTLLPCGNRTQGSKMMMMMTMIMRIESERS